ncbi:putative signal peptidase I [Periconia macrospinosa]|uniref:Signal peptidase complex catalytic subunit SEC11 n=1 Tax=Periconia macrospinosa TaxID=97972 RepID=A0A2V1DT78_9PLEO|nr:putative signal peptidase I [Periconia macrospinosa]
MLRLFLLSFHPLTHTLSFLYIAFVILRLAVSTQYPIHVVISASMAPAFFRGDILIISNNTDRIKVGDIPVVWFEDATLPMVHRAVKVVWGQRKDVNGDGSEEMKGSGEANVEQFVLTKGDNSPIDDVALYPWGQKFVYREQIIGVVKWYVPWLGWPAIWLQETPYLKIGLLGILIGVGLLF